jgi:hypothetical protein
MQEGVANPAETVGVLVTKICSLAKKRNEVPDVVRSSSPFGLRVRSELDSVGNAILSALRRRQRRVAGLRATISKGATNLPAIFWVAIVPSGKTVSTGPSATICFGKRGEGVVCGLMTGGYFASSRLMCARRGKTAIKVDVDGPKAATRYNNKFVNPKEFLVPAINGAELVDHMVESVDLLLEFVSGDQVQTGISGALG